MGAIQEFDIFLDDSLEVYHSGERLTGHVALTLTKDLAMKEPEDNSEIPLLAAGQYTFPFHFTLPNQPGIPCSFECGRLACIRFYVQATIDISWAVDPVAERYFSFIGSDADVNLPKFTKSVQASDRKSMRWRCRSSGPIALKAEMQRSGYCSGEYINIRTRLENNSEKPMKLRVKLLQNVDLMAGSTKRHSRKGSYEVLSYTSPPVLPEQEYVLQTARLMQIPLLPPTIDCQLIRVRYVIKVSLLVDEKPELNILFPTTIGNIPYKGKDGSRRQISYGYACQRSCGGNSDTVTYSDGDKVFNLKPFTPLYLTVFPIYDTSRSAQNGALAGGLYRNGTLNGTANGSTLMNGGTIQTLVNGTVPPAFPISSVARNWSPMHTDSINSEIEESITISSQSACNVTKVNTRMPAPQLSRKASECSGSLSGSLRNSQESIFNGEKRNSVLGVENKAYCGSVDELSRNDIVIHPDIHAESTNGPSVKTANGVKTTYRRLANGGSTGERLTHLQNDFDSTEKDSCNNKNTHLLLTSSNSSIGTPNGKISPKHLERNKIAHRITKDPETGQFEIPVKMSPEIENNKNQSKRNTAEFTPVTEVGRIDTISPDSVQGSPKPTNRRRINFRRSSDNRRKVYASSPNGKSHQRSNSEDSTFNVNTISDRIYPHARIPEEQHKRSSTFTQGQGDAHRFNGNAERNSLSSNASSCSDNQDSRNSVSPVRHMGNLHQFQRDKREGRNLQNSLPHNYNMQPSSRAQMYTEVTNEHFRENKTGPEIIALEGLGDGYSSESFSLTL